MLSQSGMSRAPSLQDGKLHTIKCNIQIVLRDTNCLLCLGNAEPWYKLYRETRR